MILCIPDQSCPTGSTATDRCQYLRDDGECVRPIASRGHASPTVVEACKFLDEVKKVLIKKNASYGDSASSPLQVFSKASPEEALRARIDDKLRRVACGGSDLGEDTLLDLAGYLALLKGLMSQQR